ncbi:MAG: lysozyme family protein, partial [Lachnospiraceae bacterium]|nr:lysozyme family protein [Lachnospiraceae bacterium]
ENIAASAPRNSSGLGALAALFLMPLLFLMAIAGALRGGGSAQNVGLSDDVIVLMPQISAACQVNGIPEYVPLVAAVIMQESGGRVADVGGDVMQCAEGMGLPVGTPVSLEESINFGTSIMANNLQLAGAAGPTDIPAISLALQGYNFGNGYISWAQARGGYTKENAREFSEMQAAAHGWSGYGDIEYVDHVLRYYQVSVGGMGEASAIADGRFAYPFPGHTWDTYPGHNGIDISFADCYGEPVYAVADGTVRYTQDGWVPAYGVGGMWSFGNSVFVEHGDGWISAYAHLSVLAVAPGEYVTQGQLVGYIGSTGNSTGPHLHLALYHNGDAGIGGQNFAELAWPECRA